MILFKSGPKLGPRNENPGWSFVSALLYTIVAPDWAIRWRLLLSSIKNATKSKQTMKKRFNLRHRSNYLTKLCVSLFLNKLFFATFWFNELSKIGVFNHRSKLKWAIHKPRRHLRGEKGISLNLLNKTYSIKLFMSEGGGDTRISKNLSTWFMDGSKAQCPDFLLAVW